MKSVAPQGLALLVLALSACWDVEAVPETPATERPPRDAASGSQGRREAGAAGARDAPDAGPALPDAAAPANGIPWPPAADGTVAGMREARQRFDRHAQCISSSACEPIVTTISESGELSYDNGAARCVLSSLRRDNAGSFAHRQAYEGAEGPALETYLLLHPTGLAEVTTREAGAQGMNERYSTQLCVLSPRAIERCLAELPTDDAVLADAPACVSPRYWFTQCLGTDQASLPDVICL